jgi:membrane associated rhomboid family serine protease
MVVEPRVTYALVAMNVVAFFVQMFSAGSGRPRAGEIYEKGVLFGPYVDDGEWWRLVTSGFLHADPIHLLLNLVILFLLGQNLEPAMGHVKFAFLYGASLLAGSFGALLLSPEAATIGASGAVYGLMGAIVVHLRDRGIPLMQTFVGPLLLISVLWNFTREGISVGGHFGGLAGGALAALLMLYADRRRSTPLAIAACVAVAAVSVAGAIVAAGTTSLYG